MGLHKKNKSGFLELIDLLEKDRAWILEQIDRGTWPELRLDLAALERELNHNQKKWDSKDKKISRLQ